MDRIFLAIALLLLLAGCAAIPILSFFVGSGYEGYTVWKSGEATRYYSFDLDTTHKAVMKASKEMNLEVKISKSSPKEGYSMDTVVNVPMHIDILPIKKKVTAVVTSIPTFGDKNYVELFYKTVDNNLPKKK